MSNDNSLTLRCIPQLLIGLKLRKCELEIDLRLGSNRDLLQSMEDGKLDAVVIGMQEAPAVSKLVSISLFDDDIHLAVPVDSPFSERTQIDLTELRDEKFVTLSDGIVTSDSFDQAFAQAGFEPKVALRVGDIFSLINLVSLLLPRNRERDPNLLALAAECRMYGKREK